MQRNVFGDVSIERRAYFYAICACFAPLSFGFALSFTSPSLDGLVAEFGWSIGTSSMFAGLIPVGAIFGAFVAGRLMDTIGRKSTLHVASLMFVSGWLLLSWCTTSTMAFVSRVLCGLAVGMASLATPVYIAEIAPSHLRGALGVLNQVAVTLGILLAYILGMFYVPSDWRILARIGVFLGVAEFIGTLIVPESAPWLAGRGEVRKAEACLRKLRGPAALDKDILEELHGFRDVEEDIPVHTNYDQLEPADKNSQMSQPLVSVLLDPQVRKPLVVCLVLMCAQQLSGINAVIFFAGNITAMSGFTNAGLASTVIGAVQVVVTVYSAQLIDRTGRRRLLLASSKGIVASLVALSVYFAMADIVNVPAIALICVIVYICSFSIAMGAVPWLLMAELLPIQGKGLASGMVTLWNWSLAFVVTATFQGLLSIVGTSGSFAVFALCSYACLLFIQKHIPETKGCSTETIASFFRQKGEGMFALPAVAASAVQP